MCSFCCALQTDRVFHQRQTPNSSTHDTDRFGLFFSFSFFESGAAVDPGRVTNEANYLSEMRSRGLRLRGSSDGFPRILMNPTTVSAGSRRPAVFVMERLHKSLAELRKGADGWRADQAAWVGREMLKRLKGEPSSSLARRSQRCHLLMPPHRSRAYRRAFAGTRAQRHQARQHYGGRDGHCPLLGRF